MSEKLIDNNLNFIIQVSPIDYIGDKQIVLDFYFQHINRRQFDGLSQLLGKVYELIKDDKVNPDVFVIDWDIYLKRKLGDEIYNEEKIKLEAFFERCLLTSTVYCSATNEFYNCLEDFAKLEKFGIDLDAIKKELKGFMLFICALYRYIRGQTRARVLGLFITSLTLSEWRDLHKKFTQEAQKQEGKSKIVKKNKITVEKI